MVAVTHRLSLLRRVSHAALLQEGRLARFGEARQVIEAAAQPMAAARAHPDDPKIAPFRHRRTAEADTKNPPAEGESA